MSTQRITAAAEQAAFAALTESRAAARDHHGDEPPCPACREKIQRCMEAFILPHLPWAIAVAKRYRGPGVEHDDLVNAAILGMVYASVHFKAERGRRFLTYATRAIYQHCKETTDDGKLIYVPQYVATATQVREKLRVKLQREPTREEVYWSMNYSQQPIPLKYMDAAERAGEAPYSLDWSVERDSPVLEAMLTDRRAEEAEDAAGRRMVRREVWRLLDVLDAREREIVVRRFGLGCRRETLNEIGDSLGLTREWTRQIERRALKKMREAGAERIAG